MEKLFGEEYGLKINKVNIRAYNNNQRKWMNPHCQETGGGRRSKTIHQWHNSGRQNASSKK